MGIQMQDLLQKTLQQNHHALMKMQRNAKNAKGKNVRMTNFARTVAKRNANYASRRDEKSVKCMSDFCLFLTYIPSLLPFYLSRLQSKLYFTYVCLMSLYPLVERKYVFKGISAPL